jgi:hypothetical protein
MVLIFDNHWLLETCLRISATWASSSCNFCNLSLSAMNFSFCLRNFLNSSFSTGSATPGFYTCSTLLNESKNSSIGPAAIPLLTDRLWIVTGKFGYTSWEPIFGDGDVWGSSRYLWNLLQQECRCSKISVAIGLHHKVTGYQNFQAQPQGLNPLFRTVLK